ncbi:TIR domain-containing protein [Pyxidicoccus caerfyrddinensis]|uniref:TIR domain-containing protein n=1 Tax=Pyxidicoccus caerfyrddinensis TaxID=2709663 RepID=UPI0013DA2B31|nr:TIR domain-containing protein [Pyxidicoccus caerfyrddinensis]
MPPEQVTVLELIWSHYKQHGDWPPKARFAVQLRHQGLELDKLAASASWLSVDSEKVRAGFAALVTLPEVRHLLEPLPSFLRLLARRFLEQADPDEGLDAPRPRVEAAEFFALWREPAHAAMAARLIERFLGWYVSRAGSLDSDTFYFIPELRNLRYEHVGSIDDFMALQPVRHGWVRHEPQGVHLELLKAVHASVQKTGRWPKLVRFTIENRDTLGFVPELVDELTPAFIRQESLGYGVPRRIALTSRALPYVEGEPGLALAASIVRAIGELWFDAASPSDKTFTIEQIAAKLRLPEARVLSVARLLEDQPWGWGNPGGADDSGWYVMVHEDVIQHFIGVQSWKEYVAIRSKHCPGYELAQQQLDLDASLSPSENAAATVSEAVLDERAVRQRKKEPPGRRTVTARPKVFLGHGHSPVWLVLKEFIRSELELEPVEFNSTPMAGQLTVQRLKDVLEECTLAFLVMTAEVELATGGGRQARPNVIHEIGLFQGRLGFDRTLILVEQGCAEFSNIAGLGHIPFPPNDIQACFERVRQAVRRFLPGQGAE